MRHFALAITIAVCSFSPAAPAQAQDYSNAPLPLHVWLRREAAPFVETRYTAIITAGKDKFAFLVPEDYYLRGDPATGTFTLANAQGNCSVTFTVIPAASSDNSPLSPDAYRDRVLRDYPSGKIISEFTAAAGGGSGPGFDLQWKASESLLQCKRVAFVSSPAGVLKFTATTTANHFDALKSVLNSMLMTVRQSTDGVLKVPPLPSDS